MKKPTIKEITESFNRLQKKKRSKGLNKIHLKVYFDLIGAAQDADKN